MSLLRLVKMSLKRSKRFPVWAQRTFRMDSSQIIGILVGGVFVSALGGAAEYLREKEMPSYKGLARDFLIGAVLVVFLLQMVPESMSSLLGYLPRFGSFTSAIPSMKGLTEGDAGPDLQIGPARF